MFCLIILSGTVQGATYPQSTTLDLKVGCSDLNCDITEVCLLDVVRPDSTILLQNVTMTNQGNFFNYSLNTTQTSQLGVYDYYVECDTVPASSQVHYNDNFKITVSGTDPSTAQGIIYAILLFATMFIMVLCLYGAVTINGANEFELNKIIKINYNKYIKQGLWFLSYLFLIFTVFFATEISTNFLQLTFISDTLGWIHIVLWIGLVPIFFIFVTFSLIKWLADLELQDLAKRNLKPYG